MCSGRPVGHGQELQAFKDCVIGKRVSTNDGRKGTITRLDPAWSNCYVRFDDNGKEAGLLYSLLNSEGGQPRRQISHRAIGQNRFRNGPAQQGLLEAAVRGRIGLNADDGSFYATTCELNRNKH